MSSATSSISEFFQSVGWAVGLASTGLSVGFGPQGTKEPLWWLMLGTLLLAYASGCLVKRIEFSRGNIFWGATMVMLAAPALFGYRVDLVAAVLIAGALSMLPSLFSQQPKFAA